MATPTWPAHGSANWDTGLKAYVNGVTALSPYDYGFVGDGTTDDTTALQNTINACPSGGEIVLPHTGNAKITSPLSITKGITIRGRGQYTQRIQAVGCDAFHISAGVSNVKLEGFEIAQSVRDSTTNNTLVGINFDGTSTSVSQYHILRDIYIDGFYQAIRTRYVYQSTFDNVRSGFGRRGITAYGKSVNNVITNCQFQCAGGTTASIAIALYGEESSTDSTTVASEGWMISNTLTYGANTGIDLYAYNHVYITNSIIDSNLQYGIRVQSTTGAFSNNIVVAGNFIGMNAAAAAAGIYLLNAVANSTQLRYARITDNDVWCYDGMACTYGINAGGSLAYAIIKGNTVYGFSTNDIAAAAKSIVIGNACLSSITTNIHAPATGSVIANNVGVVG